MSEILFVPVRHSVLHKDILHTELFGYSLVYINWAFKKVGVNKTYAINVYHAVVTGILLSVFFPL